MGKIKQHFIPDLLLRRFASRIRGKQYHVYMFRKDEEPVEPNTRDVASERYFYGKTNEFATEDDLSKKETIYADMLRRLDSDGVTNSDQLLICEFLAHLIVRTRNVREGFAAACEVMFTEGMRKLADATFGPKTEKRLMRVLQREAKAQGKRRLSRREMLSAIYSDEFKTGAARLLEYGKTSGDFDGVSEQAHKRALARSDAFDSWKTKLLHLKWTIVRTEAEPFVLGDVGAIALYANKSEFQNAFSGEGRLLATGVPISDKAFLAGLTTETRLVSAHDLNKSTAALSRDFFVASRCTEYERELAKSIGERPDLITREQLTAWID